MKNFNFLKSFSLILLLFLGLNSAWGQITEGFESGMPTSYTTGNINLNSGTWNCNNVIRGTNRHSGSYGMQIRNQTGAFAATPPLNNGVGTISFWAAGSTALNSVQVRYSTDNGENWTQIESTFNPAQNSFSQYTATLNSSASNIQIQFYRTAGTIYIDDVTITSFASSEPTLFASPTAISGLDYVEGSGPSPADSFTLSASNWDESDVGLLVDTDFEISENGTEWTDEINLTAYDGTEKMIYTRLKSGLSIGDYSGSVLISGGSSDDVIVNLLGTVTPPPPTNDKCADAATITVNGGTLSGTLESATNEGEDFNNKNDVWYTFTPSYNETYTVTLSNFSGDVDLELYQDSCPSSDGEFIENAATSNSPEIITTALTSGTVYYVRVLAWDLAGEDSFNIEVSAPVPQADCETPTESPTSLIFETVESSSVIGSFSTAEDADSYLVILSENSDLGATPVDEISYNVNDSLGNGTIIQAGNAATFTASGLNPTTTYYFFVFAYNGECFNGPLYNSNVLTGNATTTEGPIMYEDFSDNDFTSNPVWSGNTTGFSI